MRHCHAQLVAQCHLRSWLARAGTPVACSQGASTPVAATPAGSTRGASTRAMPIPVGSPLAQSQLYLFNLAQDHTQLVVQSPTFDLACHFQLVVQCPSSILGLPAIIVVAGNAIDLCHRLGAMPLSTCGAMRPSFLACPHAGTPVACTQGASIPVTVTAAGSTRGAVALLFLALSGAMPSSTLGVAGNAIHKCHRLGAMPLPTCGAMPSSTFGIPIPMGSPTTGAVPPSTFRPSTEHRGAVPPSAVAFNLLSSCSALSHCDVLPTRTPVGS
jgi:hypothetical protein